jgi:hypothetical protein
LLIIYKVLHAVSTTGRVVERLKSRTESDEDIKILNWLSKLIPKEKQRSFLTERQEGTGEYLLKGQGFVRWWNGENRILWCTGSGE